MLLSGTLVSFMAVSKTELPINTLYELLSSGEYEAGMISRGVALEGLFRVSFLDLDPCDL